jgi:hypothetical protein
MDEKARFVSRHITKDEWSTECSGDGNYVRSWRCVRAGMQASKNTKGFWGEIRTSGLSEYGLWPARVANPELDPGGVTELLMTLGAEIIVALL